MSDAFRVVRGDITRLPGLAIVRCVATGTWADPGHDPILLAGGDDLLVAVELHEPLVEARPVVTVPFGLPATAVIHVAAPSWRGGDHGEDRRLALAIERVFVTAVRHRLPRLAFSPIGPGFPPERAARIAVATIDAALIAAPAIEEVLIVCPDEDVWRIYDDAAAALLD